MSDFESFPKIARLNREIVITEKIDGTNAHVLIVPAATPTVGIDEAHVIARSAAGDVMIAGSRNRYITPAVDNFGFAAWVKTNAETLWALGPGRHYGEWWGAGIQRRYGLTEKRFSLFNTARWIRSEEERVPQPELHENRQRVLPACCHVVPVLYQGPYSQTEIAAALVQLAGHGSVAAPGFMDPEGVVIFHTAAGVLFKVTVANDAEAKGARVRQ